MTDVAKMEFQGTDETLAIFSNYIAKTPDLVLDELGGYAEKILSASKHEVPWDQTHLLQSGTVQPYNEMGQIGYQIGYKATAGTEDYNYGIRQHEDLTLHHPKPGTKAKYLEDPFHRIQPEVVPGIVRRIDSFYRQGIPNMAGMKASGRAALGNLGGRFI